MYEACLEISGYVVSEISESCILRRREHETEGMYVLDRYFLLFMFMGGIVGCGRFWVA